VSETVSPQTDQLIALMKHIISMEYAMYYEILP